MLLSILTLLNYFCVIIIIVVFAFIHAAICAVLCVLISAGICVFIYVLCGLLFDGSVSGIVILRLTSCVGASRDMICSTSHSGGNQVDELDKYLWFRL